MGLTAHGGLHSCIYCEGQKGMVSGAVRTFGSLGNLYKIGPNLYRNISKITYRLIYGQMYVVHALWTFIFNNAIKEEVG